MEKLPFNPKGIKTARHMYEVWHHGRMIGKTEAVSAEQAINNVLYRLGLVGHISLFEYKSVVARLVDEVKHEAM